MDDVQAPSQSAPYLTASEVADYLGIALTTVRNWLKAGTFMPAFTTGTGIHLYERAAVELLAEQRRGGK